MREINSTEIAKLAGVSRSTVSRVINNYSNVPQKTREKVLKVIRENNYYPSLYAQVLAGKKTGTIVLITVDDGVISNDAIHTYLITRVIESASSFGYYVLTVVIRDISTADARRKIKEVFLQGRVDGGIVIGVNNHEPLIDELIQEGFILGVFEQEQSPGNEPNRINYNLDNKNGALKAIDYLVSLNHEKIGIINGSMNRLAGLQRYEGFLEGMKKHGLPINEEWVLSGDFNKEAGYKSMVKLIKKGIKLPTAIFAANDSIAFGAMRAMEEYSIKVPGDISIIGLDDHLLSAYTKPPLTTLKVDFADTIHKLTIHVINVIRNKKVAVESVSEMKLIIRESCKRLIN